MKLMSSDCNLHLAFQKSLCLEWQVNLITCNCVDKRDRAMLIGSILRWFRSITSCYYLLNDKFWRLHFF